MDTGETFAAFFSKFKFLIQKEPVLLDWQVSAVEMYGCIFFFFQFPSLQDFVTLYIGMFQLEVNEHSDWQLCQGEMPFLASCLLSLQHGAWRCEDGCLPGSRRLTITAAAFLPRSSLTKQHLEH